MSLVDRVEDSLKHVIDPETQMNVVEMGLIRDLAVTENGKVELKFRPSSYLCPLAFKLTFDIHTAIKTIKGVREVRLEIVDCLWAEQINKLLKEEKAELGRKKE